MATGITFPSAKRKPDHLKDGIQIQCVSKSVREQIELLPAPLTPRQQFCWSEHMKRRARCAQKCVPECIVIEEPMQISAKDSSVFRDAPVRKSLAAIVLPHNGRKRLCFIKVFSRAHVNLVATYFAGVDRLTEQQVVAKHPACRNSDLITCHEW